MTEIRALVFDVFGTVVDWRSSVIAECEQFGAVHGVELDWPAFVDDWRYDGYIGGIGLIRKGELPVMTTDQLHRRKLDQLLEANGLEHIPEEERSQLNRAWHRLNPWNDSVAGLARLRTRFIVSTLSNGNVSLLVNMAKFAGLTWDCILAADIIGAFKPSPEAYQSAPKFFDLQPAEVMLVAAHKNDLRAAQAQGLQAAFVPRPEEAGPSRSPDLSFDSAFEFNARDFHQLADQLGCPGDHVAK
jgi:2-haloacid dehalogenase